MQKQNCSFCYFLAFPQVVNSQSALVPESKNFYEEIADQTIRIYFMPLGFTGEWKQNVPYLLFAVQGLQVTVSHINQTEQASQCWFSHHVLFMISMKYSTMWYLNCLVSVFLERCNHMLEKFQCLCCLHTKHKSAVVNRCSKGFVLCPLLFNFYCSWFQAIFFIEICICLQMIQ